MAHPDFVSQADLDRWDQSIENDLGSELAAIPVLKEVVRSGLWLGEKLKEQLCPDDLIVNILYHGGKLSFGRDPWEVHQLLLQQYNSGELILENNEDIVKN